MLGSLYLLALRTLPGGRARLEVPLAHWDPPPQKATLSTNSPSAYAYYLLRAGE